MKMSKKNIWDTINKTLTETKYVMESMKRSMPVKEARAVTEQVIEAFLRGQSKRISNTHTDGHSLYLHNNEIAKIENYVLSITNAGYPTATTKERLNGLPGVNVRQKAGIWYLNDKQWNGDWIEIGHLSDLKESVEDEDELTEGSGAEAIFLEIQSKLPKAVMNDGNVIDCSMYQESQIVTALKGLGFQFKKVLDRKLHFYNPQTSISLYLAQGNRAVTLVP